MWQMIVCVAVNDVDDIKGELDGTLADDRLCSC